MASLPESMPQTEFARFPNLPFRHVHRPLNPAQVHSVRKSSSRQRLEERLCARSLHGIQGEHFMMNASGRLDYHSRSWLESGLIIGLSVGLLAYLTGFAIYMTWPGNYCPSSGFLSDLFFPLLWLLSPIIPCC